MPAGPIPRAAVPPPTRPAGQGERPSRRQLAGKPAEARRSVDACAGRPFTARFLARSGPPYQCARPTKGKSDRIGARLVQVVVFSARSEAQNHDSQARPPAAASEKAQLHLCTLSKMSRRPDHQRPRPGKERRRPLETKATTGQQAGPGPNRQGRSGDRTISRRTATSTAAQNHAERC